MLVIRTIHYQRKICCIRMVTVKTKALRKVVNIWNYIVTRDSK